MTWTFDAHDQTWNIYGTGCWIWMAPRPHYCDRGNWLAHIEPLAGKHDEWRNLSLDGQDGWPRYYFDLDRAKAEIEAWLIKRGQMPPVTGTP